MKDAHLESSQLKTDKKKMAKILDARARVFVSLFFSLAIQKRNKMCWRN